ncbi:peptide chain release factor N(5)-glutamine methyltransferase [Mesorhizobium sp. BAC0120]|uniref:peptide chain release factor N(5)-glutamine methyltransferase n=1 Tax=Mesorhizobium sp. BAC0120 TaxID=3090670 RepID=UPI00298C07C0|nr:peptide chain release factor N(5)-glutamine methyltransferase [Mesorhizobium sp. BAC0120]MDW6026347.1 peptide chain release factor N(5)-glutamine methyltransferase [Mesorhizobium sp. BAC0120]
MPKTEGAATLAAVLAEARRRLAAGDMDDPALEARMIVEHFTGTARKDAIATPERSVSAGEIANIDDAVNRRLAGEPVHRIFGWREFYGLRLKLSPDTLEPRPDTETLVDAVLPFVRETVRREGHCRVLDLGTGTGAIGLAIAAQVPEVIVTATDISAGSLATATGNAARLGLAARFIPRVSDWFSAVDGKFHAIVSNPPYIEAGAIAGLQLEVRLHDPVRALDGGADGLDAYRAIAAGAPEHLDENAIIAVEVGEGQGRDVALIFSEAGFRMASAHRDLAGTERALVFGG